MKVLVVEDNEDIAYLVARTLQFTPLLEAKFVTSDFARLLRHQPWEDIDVAVLDFHLGGSTTGRDIALWLKEHRPDIRRVMFTAQVVEDAMRNECHIVIRKPFTIDELLAAIGVEAIHDGD